jgi:hypothetical protein
MKNVFCALKIPPPILAFDPATIFSHPRLLIYKFQASPINMNLGYELGLVKC